MRWTNTTKTLVGRGRMISGRSKTMQASSQTIRNTAIAIHGMARRDDAARAVGHAACSWWMRSRSS